MADRPLATLTARLAAALARHGERPIAVTPGRDAPDRPLTARAALEQSARFAAGLVALGVRPGEPVLLWSENREQWLIAELALLWLGAPGVPRGAEAPADEIAYIVDKVRARVAIVEKPELLRRFAAAGHQVEQLVLLTGNDPAGRALSFEQCLAQGDAATAARLLAEAPTARRPTDVATIVFTSGTTGRPKGVVLTQANLAANLAQVLSIIDFVPAGATGLSILPPWHMFERMVEYALIELGVQFVYTDRRHFAKDLARFRPAVLPAVPRLWMAIEEGVRAKLAHAPPRQRAIVETALARCIARQKAARFGATPRPSPLSAPLDWLLQRLVLRKIAVALGVDRLASGLPISGGGSLPEHVDLFFAALGVPLMNGYGLTETSPVLALRRSRHPRGGTVGAPLPETEIAIRRLEDGAPQPIGARGVIHARGPQVMGGYFEEPEATARVRSADGWFDTGDLGHLDRHGELAITGRAKETIVLLSGENIEPEPLENALTASPWIAQALVVGQDQKQLGALLVPRLPHDTPAPPRAELEALLRREVDARVAPAAGFRPHERIGRIALLDEPFTVENGGLSQTLKIKRHAMLERHAARIAELYCDGGDSTS